MIDYPLLSKAIQMYEWRGYKYVEAPWAVPYAVARATNASDNAPYPLSHHYLVGSAEQGLLYLAAKGDLPEGKYVACTPCFRREPQFNSLNRKYFMKVELFDSQTTTAYGAMILLHDAWSVMDTLSKPDGGDFEAVATSDGIDLNLNGIEVGSYGVRQASFDGTLHQWAYGTGLALPRFTQAVSGNY